MTMQLAGVVGWPVAHSLSPRLHGFWLRLYGLEGAYVPLAVERTDFARVIDGLQRAGFAGVNVTIPHKEAAFALAHSLGDAARKAGAANLLVFSGGRIAAHNTDGEGLRASLVAALGADALTGKTAVLLGAGGAARAAILALDGLGARAITILNRNAARAQALKAAFAPQCSAQITTSLWSDWEHIAGAAALVVNCTSAGMAGHGRLDLSLEPLSGDAAVCDIVYNPLDTALLKAARARGLKTVDGLGMLMHQAVPSFEAFYGLRPEVTPALRAELEQALRHAR